MIHNGACDLRCGEPFLGEESPRIERSVVSSISKHFYLTQILFQKILTEYISKHSLWEIKETTNVHLLCRKYLCIQTQH